LKEKESYEAGNKFGLQIPLFKYAGDFSIKSIMTIFRVYQSSNS